MAKHSLCRRLSFHFIASVIALSAVQPGAASDPVPPVQAQAEYRRPELVAITWQQATKPGEVEAVSPVWRPDGSLLDDAEIQWLRKDVESLQIHWWDINSQLRPLVLIFRIDETAKSPQTLVARLHDGDRSRPSGSARPSTSHHLAITCLAPNRSELGTWPGDIDVEIRVPISEPEVVRTFDRLPAADLRIDDGVRWYVDPFRGMRTEGGRRKSGFPAAVLEIDRKTADPLSTIGAVIHLKDGKVLSEDHVTLIDPEGTIEVRVSRPLDDSNPIASGEFTRRRYRLERYEKVPTRMDLKPEDPKPQPVVPRVPVFKFF